MLCATVPIPNAAAMRHTHVSREIRNRHIATCLGQLAVRATAAGPAETRRVMNGYRRRRIDMGQWARGPSESAAFVGTRASGWRRAAYNVRERAGCPPRLPLMPEQVGTSFVQLPQFPDLAGTWSPSKLDHSRQVVRGLKLNLRLRVNSQCRMTHSGGRAILELMAHARRRPVGPAPALGFDRTCR